MRAATAVVTASVTVLSHLDFRSAWLSLWVIDPLNTATKSLAVVVWHHRVLGVFWGLCSLITAVAAFSHHSWNGPFFIVLSTSVIYFGTSIGFIFGRTWARRVMCVLMFIAALWFLDMMMMCGVGGNRQGVWLMFAALCLTAYTVLFLAISAFHIPKDLNRPPVLLSPPR
jgi:hypothetical protein